MPPVVADVIDISATSTDDPGASLAPRSPPIGLRWPNMDDMPSSIVPPSREEAIARAGGYSGTGKTLLQNKNVRYATYAQVIAADIVRIHKNRADLKRWGPPTANS